jgi:hypothetical protein
MRDPEVLECNRQTEPELSVGFGRPVDRGAEVVLVAEDELVPLGTTTERVQGEVRGLGKREVVLGVAPASRLGRCLVEALGSVFPDRVEHEEPAVVGTAQEALVDERRKRVQLRVADRLRRLEREAAREHSEAGE